MSAGQPRRARERRPWSGCGQRTCPTRSQAPAPASSSPARPRRSSTTSSSIRHWLPIVFAFVLGLSFVLLMLAFRSIVVPPKAIVINLLSVGAAYGLLVLVFQKGVGNELFGFQQVDSIEAWLPLFLFSVLFGLSMDYHVFLLSRIRERYLQTGDNTEAVAFGVGSTARLITGAALIMVAVFAGFASGDLVMFQQMGFGLAVALLIDATLIRTVLLPATMQLLGERNWYLPSLARVAPAPRGRRPRVAAAGGSRSRAYRELATKRAMRAPISAPLSSCRKWPAPVTISGPIAPGMRAASRSAAFGEKIGSESEKRMSAGFSQRPSASRTCSIGAVFGWSGSVGTCSGNARMPAFDSGTGHGAV